MSYFSHAFRKDFVGFGSVRVTGDTDDLLPGQLGLFDAKTFNALPVVASNTNPKKMFLIGQGSVHATDNLSPFYGGLTEFVRSRPINPAFIEKFYVSEPTRPVNDVWTIGYNGVSTCKPITGECGSKYTIRVDVKGESALRAYNRNLYRYFTVETPCCDDCDVDCTPATADPYLIGKSLVEQINADVEISKFVNAELILETAISDANQVTFDKFILSVYDGGNPEDLADVAINYTQAVTRESRSGIISTYSIIVADGVTPASYTPTAKRLKADLCGDCPTGWTEGSTMVLNVRRTVPFVDADDDGGPSISFEDGLATLMASQGTAGSLAYQYHEAILATLAAIDADILTADITVTPILVSTVNGVANVDLTITLLDVTPSASTFTTTLSDLVVATVVGYVNTTGSGAAGIDANDEYTAGSVETICAPAAGTATAWVADGSVYKTYKSVCITVPKVCGASTSKVTAVAAHLLGHPAYVAASVAQVDGDTDCAEVISVNQYSDGYYEIGCLEKPIPTYGILPSFEGQDWKDCACPPAASPYVSGAVGIRITAAYIDTKFGDCSFSPRDYYALQPLKIEVSKIDDAELCTDQHTQWSVTHLSYGKQGTGFGETVLREYMLSMGYKQETFQHDPRWREVMDQQHMNVIDRNAYYRTYYILHSIPNSILRGMNVTNYDEKYLLAFHFKENVNTTAFENLIKGYAALNGVELETY